MSDTPRVLRFLERAAARAEGDADAEPPPEAETLRYTRDRLSEALPYAHAGAEVPSEARLRPVKQAIVAAVRPVTSNQRAFNELLLAAVDGLAATADGLAHSITRQEQRAARLQAGIATTDLTVDDLSDDLRHLRADVADLADDLHALRADLASLRTTDVSVLRSDLGTIQAKQDLIFRAAREALPGGGPDALAELSHELDAGRVALVDGLADALRGDRATVKAQVSALVPHVAGLAATGPVVDLWPGRGEWLEALRDAGVEAHGIEAGDDAGSAARDLDVRAGDGIAHLRKLPEGSARAVTLFDVAPRLTPDTLVALVDAALVALAPGGLLLVEAADPSDASAAAAAAWLDPGARPLPARVVELLALARGFAAAEVVALHDADGPTLSVDDLASADDDPARAGAVVQRVNQALAGGRRFAVLAHKAARPPA
jgi:hypothetical protein